MLLFVIDIIYIFLVEIFNMKLQSPVKFQVPKNKNKYLVGKKNTYQNITK